MACITTLPGLHAQVETAPEKPNQPDDDQIDGHDIIQQAGHHQDENAGDK